MNEAARIVSSSLLGNDFITVTLGNKAYTVYPPTIKVLCRAIEQFSCLKESDKLLDVLLSMPENAPKLLKGVSYLIVGNVPNHEEVVSRLDLDCTQDELKSALEEIILFISPRPFWEAVILAKNVSEMTAKQKS